MSQPRATASLSRLVPSSSPPALPGGVSTAWCSLGLLGALGTHHMLPVSLGLPSWRAVSPPWSHSPRLVSCGQMQVQQSLRRLPGRCPGSVPSTGWWVGRVTASVASPSPCRPLLGEGAAAALFLGRDCMNLGAMGAGRPVCCQPRGPAFGVLTLALAPPSAPGGGPAWPGSAVVGQSSSLPASGSVSWSCLLESFEAPPASVALAVGFCELW